MPGLLTITTDLKSLKYGQDQPGGGNSGQPYIQNDINNPKNVLGFDDGLIRGGAVGAFQSSVIDTSRIARFLYGDVKGYLFLTKQVGLQFSNPRLEIPKNPANIAAGLPDNALSVSTKGFLEPTRIYNVGINTLAQTPFTAFGGHLNRHGLLPSTIPQPEASKYEAIVTANNNDPYLTDPSQNNRLVSLAKTFELGDRQKNNTQVQSTLNTINTALGIFNTVTSFIGGPQIPPLNLNPKQLIIDQYTGGPDSTYGLGSDTTIRRYSFTEDGYLINRAFEQSSDRVKDSVTDLNKNLLRDTVEKGPSSYPSVPEPVLPSNVYGNARTYAAISKINGNTNTENLESISNLFALGQGFQSMELTSSNQFKIIASDPTTGKPMVTDGAIAYSSTAIKGGKILYRNSYNEVITINKSNWKDVARNVRVGSGRKDSINLTPLFTAPHGQDSLAVKIGGKDYTINDLVKFRIEAIDTDKPEQSVFMVFRAYITNFDDSVNANWDATKYIGRGEEFYIYNGFTRKINIGFKVAALSAQEMQPMYSKLNFLMSNLMPDYKDKLMRGPFMRMTVGNWIDSQPGVINNLTYTISNDSPWEIALNEPITPGGTREMVLPHIVDVSLSFTPIGVHTKEEDQTPKKSHLQSNIAQNYSGKNEPLSNYITGSENIPAGTAGNSNTQPY
jgi:hypothetical protein